MKPEITKEQAEAIEYLRELGRDDDYILSNHGEYIRHCTVLNELSIVSLAAALINGYEIIMSSEEKVRKYYEYLERRWGEARYKIDVESRLHFTSKMDGVRETLDRLGIKIEGVNAIREEADEDDAPF
ncbi:MAG: hypothetical protein ACQEWR_00415 [Bacillota bacterium]